jgi:hypothetical protein
VRESAYRDRPAVHSRGVITARGTAPVGFAGAISRALRLPNARKLARWTATFS